MSVYSVFTLIIIIVLMLNQCRNNHLLTSTTAWLFFYMCFFCISPLLLDISYITEDIYALIGIVVFALSYLCIQCFKNNRIYTFKNKDNYCEKIFRSEIIDINVFILVNTSIVLLFACYGVNGVLSLISGQNALRDSLFDTGLIGTLYTYIKSWAGYSMLLYIISTDSKIKKRHKFYIFIIMIQFLFFSFTRSDFIILVGMLTMFLLRHRTIYFQLKYLSLVLGLLCFLMSFLIVIRVLGTTGIAKFYDFSYFLESFAGNIDFTIGYIRFGELLKNNPDIGITPFVYLKILFAFIPRYIWEDKPFRGTVEIFKQENYAAFLNGESTGYTNLGVPYATFGIAGIILAMIAWCILMHKFDTVYINNLSGNRNDAFTFFYLYFAIAFVLQSFREGTDVAILNLPIMYLAFSVITKFNVLKFRFLKNSCKIINHKIIQ